MWTTDSEVIRWIEVFHWRTSRRDKLTAIFSAANKPQGLTTLSDVKDLGIDIYPWLNYDDLFCLPEICYSPRLLASEKIWVGDLAWRPI